MARDRRFHRLTWRSIAPNIISDIRAAYALTAVEKESTWRQQCIHGGVRPRKKRTGLQDVLRVHADTKVSLLHG